MSEESRGIASETVTLVLQHLENGMDRKRRLIGTLLQDGAKRKAQDTEYAKYPTPQEVQASNALIRRLSDAARDRGDHDPARFGRRRHASVARNGAGPWDDGE